MNLSIRAGLSTQTIDGELVILDKGNGRIHQLNPVASYIWQQVEAGLDVESIVNQVVESFDVDKVIAKTDFNKVIQQFKELNLID